MALQIEKNIANQKKRVIPRKVIFFIGTVNLYCSLCGPRKSGRRPRVAVQLMLNSKRAELKKKRAS